MNARLSLVAVAVVVLCGCTPPAGTSTPTTVTQTNPDTVVLPADPVMGPPMEVEVGCSETELRMPIAVVRWRRAPGAVATPSQGQRLDVTVYSEGFEKGWYASVPMDQGGKLQMQPPLRALTQVQDADATQNRMIRAFDITAERKGGFSAVDGSMNVMELKNLEPGVIYQLRMLDRLSAGWLPSPTVSVEAPVCVADMVKER